MTSRRSALLTVILGIALGVVIILLVTKAFGAPQSVSIDTATKQVINPIVKFGSGNTLDGTGATITGFPGSSYTFIDSLFSNSGIVSLVNDSATPGNSQYYGTDSGGTRGYFDLPSGGTTLFKDLDFTDSDTIALELLSLGIHTDGGGNPGIECYVTTVAPQTSVYGADIEGTARANASTVYGTLTSGEVKEATVSSLYGISATVRASNGGSSSIGYGNYSEVAELSGSAGTGKGYLYYGLSSSSVSSLELYGLWVGDLTGQATSPYFLWYDSPGVYRVKGDGVMAYYNPSFSPKYVPEAVNYERVVQQWNTNVLEYGTESGGTGTPRAVRIIGPQVKIANLTTNGFVKTSGGDGTLSATPIVGGFTAHFSRGGAVIQANDVLVTPWTCPYSGTITGYSISADTGTCTLKTWKKANGTAIPTIADVISTSGVALSSGTHIRSATVSDFTTTTVTAGDMFMAQVTATSGPTDITFQVEITR